jgi:UDP-glucose 4-epimerase
MNKTILVTGGLGYIGSHTVILLIEHGYQVVILDNLYNSEYKTLEKINNITDKPDNINFHIADILDIKSIKNIFLKYNIYAVIHFAGLKAIGESMEIPLKYYETNIYGTINLLNVMMENKCYNLIFSSTAAVYGKGKIPYTEKNKVGTGITNCYGRTKYTIELIIKDLCNSNKNFKAVILRYFNPIGAHISGLIGENPKIKPNNLMPYIQKVITGEKDKLIVFGNDYNTKDGTCIRDYVHVMDLSNAHVLSLKCFDKSDNIFIYNVGTGKGYSVLELINTMEQIINKKILYEIGERRAGDMAEFYANSSKIQKELNWKPKYELNEMCRDVYNYIKKMK